ncbi:nuclear apoptosis-inducing factor 1 [Osmerus eperlanus]|uniref:nuclear apoptosis-inducing factor 1 n=1 Tax=Osmerus eperlanus TaxID=29151 RepID=UPI002E1305FA
MSSPLYYNQDSVTRFKKRKARFTFSEVHILLDEVRKNRHVVVGKFNRGVPTDIKKHTWAEITARVNEIGDCQREVIEVIKKWSDLKCDTKRKVAAMRSGVGSQKSLSARGLRELTPTESIVHQILEMDAKRDVGEASYDHLRLLGDNGEGMEEEEEDDEDMVGMRRSPNGGMDMASMPAPHSMGGPMLGSMPGLMPPLPSHNTDQLMAGYSGSSRDVSQPSYEMQYEIPPMEDTDGPFVDSDDDLLPSANLSSTLPEDRPGNSSAHKDSSSSGAPKPAPSSSAPPLLPSPLAAQPPQSSRDSLLQNATLSVQEQHATNVLLETVSRSLELLSESVQQLAETQQEFVRDSLQLQRETVQVLRDFTSGALALMHDKLNGRPAL